MIRRLIPLILMLLTFSACAGLKPPVPLDPSRKSAVFESCRRPFLPGSYRLVHTLERVAADGAKGTAIGILSADPRTRSFRTVLMTLEGWVLFDVEAGESLTVRRAVPPFDSPAFAEALAEDVRLAFFPPGEEPAAWGGGENDAEICRYERADGRLAEVAAHPDGDVEVRLYGTGKRLLKRAAMTRLRQPGLAEEIEIRNVWPPYTLRLRLLESEALGGDAGTGSQPEDLGSSAAGCGNGKGKGMP